MSKTDEEIDELYRLPLGDFTAARNALAKRRGPSGAAIKQLEKPSVPAWAVNQLYWRHRDVYDRLVAASERLRAAHRSLLGGKPSDVRAAEQAHREAVHTAAEQARRLLAEARQARSPQTLSGVIETLEALPSSEAPGHLTKPLRPRGFEALAGLSIRPVALPTQSPPKLTLVAKQPAPARDTAQGRRAAAKETERVRRAEQELRQAQMVEQRARGAVEKAEREVSRCEADLVEARRALEERMRDLEEATAAHSRARLALGTAPPEH